MRIQSFEDLKAYAKQLNLAVLPGFTGWSQGLLLKGKSYDDIAEVLEDMARQLSAA